MLELHLDFVYNVALNSPLAAGCSDPQADLLTLVCSTSDVELAPNLNSTDWW